MDNKMICPHVSIGRSEPGISNPRYRPPLRVRESRAFALKFTAIQDESRYIKGNQGEHPIFISPNRFLRHARVWVSDVRRASAPFSFYFSMI